MAMKNKKIKNRKGKKNEKRETAIKKAEPSSRRRGQAAIVQPCGSAARSLRAQAAMEYLMTYGWAILVIVIVLAILAFFLPNLTKIPETCQFTQPGFSCSENPAVVFNSSTKQVSASFNLQNGKGQTLIIREVVCTTSSLADMPPKSSWTDTSDVKVSAGQSMRFDAKCVDKSGSAISLSPNSGFRGILVVYYNFENDVTTAERPADAILTGTVLAG